MNFAPQNPLTTNVPPKVQHFQTLSENFGLTTAVVVNKSAANNDISCLMFSVSHSGGPPSDDFF